MKSLRWKILGTGSVVLAASLVERGLSAGWRAATGNTPPAVPEDPQNDWVQAVGWAALSGAVLGAVRVLATRRAAVAHLKATGQLPKAYRHD